MGEVTEDEVAVAKERGLEVEPEEVTELQPHSKTNGRGVASYG